MEKKTFLVVLFNVETGLAEFTTMKAENMKDLDPGKGREFDFVREISPQQMNNLRHQLQKALPELV